LVEFLGSFMYKIISSANKDNLISSFPIWIHFSSVLLLWLGIPTTVLNKSGQSRHPCLPPDFRGNGFSFTPFSMMLVHYIYSYFLFFFWYWGLNSGPILWATPPALFVRYFKIGSHELFAWVASNCDPPDLCPLSS
jgi:hypothetical protein